jgi:hypothetical protein
MWWAGLLVFVFFSLSYIVRKQNEELETERKSQEEQRARVRALYPESKSYEERMSVRYGPTGEHEE